MSLSRREFIKVFGIGALAATSGCTKISEFMDEGEVSALSKGVEKWMPTVCGQCSGGCGILARVIDKRVVKLDGNPMHPLNRGVLCARGQAGLQVLYDPDRIRSPLKRIGQRGSDRWVQISWDEAIKDVAERLKKIRNNGQPHSVVTIAGGERGLMTLLLKRFMDSFGSPNYYLMQDDNDDMQVDAVYHMHGIKGRPLFDISNARYILSFGSALLESFSSPVQTLRAYGEFRARDGKMRGRLIHISPRLSVTGIKADRWIPVRQGTEGIFALGLAHVIIKEGIYDKEFIDRYTRGFDGFREMVLKKFGPSTVSRITSAPEGMIIEIAREFARSMPSIAITCRSRLYDQMAVHSLNALIGGIGKRGGVFFSSGLEPYDLPPAIRDSVSERGLAMPRISDSLYMLPEAMKSKKPYGIDALLIYNCNPLFSVPGMHEAFKDVPFIVSFSPFMNETERMADIILPDHTFLEGWGDVLRFTADGRLVIGIRQPVSRPLYKTMQTGDAILTISRSMGGGIKESMPYRDFKELLFYSLRKIHKRKGEVFGIDKGLKTEDEFLEAVLKSGGYWEPSKGGIPPVRFSSHYEKAVFHGDERDYPFYLHIYRLSTHSGIMDYNQPYLKESLTPEVHEAFDSWVEINPETGRRLGISNGDLVQVESVKGRIKLRVKLYPGIMPDVVSIPYGLGEGGNGRWNENIGVNPERILVRDMDLPSGNLVRNSTRVRIYKV